MPKITDPEVDILKFWKVHEQDLPLLQVLQEGFCPFLPPQLVPKGLSALLAILSQLDVKIWNLIVLRFWHTNMTITTGSLMVSRA